MFSSARPRSNDSIDRSPDTLRPLTPSAAASTCRSPETSATDREMPAFRMRTLPLALFTLVDPATSSNQTSPEAVRTSTDPKRPVPFTSAEAVTACTSAPCGVRTSTSYEASRANHDLWPCSATTTSWAPSRRDGRKSTCTSSAPTVPEPRPPSRRTFTLVSSVSSVVMSIRPEGIRTISRTASGVG